MRSSRISRPGRIWKPIRQHNRENAQTFTITLKESKKSEDQQLIPALFLPLQTLSPARLYVRLASGCRPLSPPDSVHAIFAPRTPCDGSIRHRSGPEGRRHAVSALKRRKQSRISAALSVPKGRRQADADGTTGDNNPCKAADRAAEGATCSSSRTGRQKGQHAALPGRMKGNSSNSQTGWQTGRKQSANRQQTGPGSP